MTMYLRQHGLMSFISLNIPEREINLHFVNSAGEKMEHASDQPCKMIINYKWKIMFYYETLK
jgi:hypothetical protein